MICETSFVSVLCGEPPGSASRFDFQAGRQGACPIVYHHNQNLAHKAQDASLLVLGILLPPPCLLGLGSSRGGPTYLGRRWCGQGQDKMVELDQRSTSQDEDPLSVRRGLVNRWKT